MAKMGNGMSKAISFIMILLLSGIPTLAHSVSSANMFQLGRSIDLFGGADNMGYGPGYPGPFQAPYGGQGWNYPMDMVFPASEVTFYASVTNESGLPAQSVIVDFAIQDPSASTVTLPATTNATCTAK